MQRRIAMTQTTRVFIPPLPSEKKGGYVWKTNCPKE